MLKNYYQKLKTNINFFLRNIFYFGKKNLYYFLFSLIFILGLFLQKFPSNGWIKNEKFIFGFEEITFEKNPIIFVLIIVLTTFFLIILIILFFKKHKLYLKIAFLIIFLGTLGNFYQRFLSSIFSSSIFSKTTLKINGVYDYLPFFEFPIYFNIEDLMIFFGTIIILVRFFKIFIDKKKTKNLMFQRKKLKIVYFDDSIIVVQKPYGIVSHPDAHHKENNVCTILKNYLNFPKEKINPGIIQRLDKQATGIMVVARDQETEKNLKWKMKKRQIIRKYYALCEGEIKKNKFIIDVPLKKPGKIKKAQVSILGKKAISHFEVLEKNSQNTFLKCELKTGRTHQLRAHLKYINHPIVNDNLYQNKKEKNDYIFLHAYYLKFIHPKTKKMIEFKVKKPIYFDKLLQKKEKK